MARSHLRPCPGCSRHVRVGEGACPFCRVSFDPLFGATRAPLPPSKRLARAALFAVGAATALTPVFLLDCSASPSYGGAAVLPPYGLSPVPEDAGEGPEQDSALVAADVQVPRLDAGDSAASDAGSDAATDTAANDGGIDAGDAD